MEGAAAMNQLLMTALHMGMLAIELFVFLLLSSAFFPFRLSFSKSFTVCVLAFFFNYVVLIYLNQSILFKLTLGCVIFSLLAKTLYPSSILPCIFLALSFLSLVNIFDNLLLFLLSSIFRQSFTTIMADPFSYYLQAYSAKTLELTIASFIHTWGRQRFYHRKPSVLNFVKLTLFPMLSLICAVTLLSTFSAYPQSPPQLLFFMIALLVSDIVSIFLLNQFEIQQQAILDNRLLQRELKLAHDNVSELLDSYQKERKLTHDFQNKLLVIQGLLQQEQTAGAAQDYVGQLIKHQYKSAISISTHRTVVDVLINHKYSAAAAKKIQFRVQLDDLSSFPLPDDALVVVLSNLLDNAMEACEKIQDPTKRLIVVKAKVDKIESILCIQNSVDIPVTISNGRIVTSKLDKHRHGYGLQNVISIIESFSGTYAMHCENHKFVFVASFMRE